MVIVVEDIEANEIHRFFIFDANMQLGIVRAGKYIHTFDPDRVYSFYNTVENQLHDFVGNYPGAFKYFPRRAYDYLKKPRFLHEFSQGSSELSESSWLADSFLIIPLIGFGNKTLPVAQQEANTESIYRWSTMPPNSHRFYHLQDMRLDRRTPSGWGCILKTSDMAKSLKGANRSDLLSHIKSKRPIFVELSSPEELDSLLQWLVILKEAGLNPPSLIFKLRNHKDWGKDITKLLDLPNSRILTAGATISSLSTIIRYMKKDQGNYNWSKRLIFASAYPETQLGDSVSEILSYLLSRNLSATPEEVQRILGGNLLSIMPPRPPFLVYMDNKMSVMAEESLGKSAMNELVRLLQLLNARKMLRLASVDHMISEEGGIIDFDCAVVTVIQQNNERATSLSILNERNGSLMISGWKKAFSDSMIERDSTLLQTLIRANAKLDGPIYSSPAHLVRFDETILECLQIDNPKIIMSALHFGTEIAKIERGTFRMCSRDMDALDIANDEYVLALETRTGQFCAGTVKEHQRCSEKCIVMSEIDARMGGFRESSVVNIIKLEGEISIIDQVVLAFDSNKNVSNSELLTFLHLHEEEILQNIENRMIGIGTRLSVGNVKIPLALGIAQTHPRLTPGEIGRISGNKIALRPVQAFREFNTVICISKANNMKNSDISQKSLATIKRQLQSLAEMVPELQIFLKGLNKKSTQIEIAAICALLVLDMLRYNRTEGKLSLVTFNENPEKFSVQHGGEIQSYIEFNKDLQSDEVLISLILSILDTTKEISGRENMAGAYRSIAEYLEDFGSTRPTIILTFTGSIGKYDQEHLPFMKVISEHERYQIDQFVMGENENLHSDLRVLKGIQSRVFPLKRFSSHLFIGHFLDIIDNIVPANISSQSDV